MLITNQLLCVRFTDVDSKSYIEKAQKIEGKRVKKNHFSQVRYQILKIE